jgi:hypothetical protein
VTDSYLQIKARALARCLIRHSPRDIRVVTDTALLPDCAWCADDGHRCSADISMYHDSGVVETCGHCVLTAAAEAVDASESGDFFVEVTRVAVA